MRRASPTPRTGLGDVCLERQDYAAALAHYCRAYAVCEKEEDSFSILALNKKMTAAHRKLGEFDQALEYAFDMVETMTVIAELYVEKGDKLKAADTYRTVAAIHRNFKHQRMAA